MIPSEYTKSVTKFLRWLEQNNYVICENSTLEIRPIRKPPSQWVFDSAGLSNDEKRDIINQMNSLIAPMLNKPLDEG